MNLAPRDTEPGLWCRADWDGQSPGTFAVIIGVSRYDWLGGSETPAPETYGLGQLAVSALTAFQMFQWLTSRYYIEGAPLVKCWLLLAPTAEELAYEPDLAKHLTAPTFANCETALGHWHLTMQRLPSAAADASRSLFFFSGHGLEIHQEKQILLPSDYLSPPNYNWNKAISTFNLRAGLASLRVPRQWFFVDACRNDDIELRKKEVTGTKILTEDESAQVNPPSVAAVLYAAGPGKQAFQQSDPTKGLSLFGTALLDGLHGEPDIYLEPQGNFYGVELFPLQGYVKHRVAQLLVDAGASVTQAVKLVGVVDKETVTLIDKSYVQAARLPSRGAFGRLTNEDVAAASPSAPTRSWQVEALQSRGFKEQWGRLDDRTSDTLDQYRPKRRIEDELRGIRLYGLGTREWISTDAIHLHDVQRSSVDRRTRLTISVNRQDPRGFWLEIETPLEIWGCFLPSDVSGPIRFLLELDVIGNTEPETTIARLEASLAPDNNEPLRSAAGLWRRYQLSDSLDAASLVAGSELAACRGPDAMRSPLAATVVALVLLGANQREELAGWLRDFADSWPLADTSAMWAELCTRMPGDRITHNAQARAYLARLAQLGVPFTNPGLAYAASLADRFGESMYQKPETALAIKSLQSTLASLLPWFRSGGLFVTLGQLPPNGAAPRSAANPAFSGSSKGLAT